MAYLVFRSSIEKFFSILNRVQVIVIVGCLNVGLFSKKAHPMDHPVQLNCFEQHLKAAIQLNQERMPLYSKLSNRESEKISKKLIFSENLAIYFAKYYFDRLAQPFQLMGIPILCAEFVPMSTTVGFFQSLEKGPQFPRPLSVPPEPLDIHQIEENIRVAYKEAEFEGIADYLKIVIANLEGNSQHYCMTRHVLESILRAALLAPKHMEKAHALGLPSPKELSWNFIIAHLFTLSETNKIDQEAFSVQIIWGIPIICGDIPKISNFNL